MPFGCGIQRRWMRWLWTLLATLATAAAKSKQFSRGQLIIGSGCCRTTGGGVRAWDEPSTAEAIATQRVHDLPMNRSACAAHCAGSNRSRRQDPRPLSRFYAVA